MFYEKEMYSARLEGLKDTHGAHTIRLHSCIMSLNKSALVVAPSSCADEKMDSDIIALL